MKKILLIILMLWGVASYAQPGYTTINSRYSWLAGKFNGLHIPAYAVTPSLNTGQYGGSGAVGLDSVTGRFYVYVQGVWERLAKYSELAAAGWTNLGTGYGLINVNDSTYRVDTALITTRAWLYKVVDSLPLGGTPTLQQVLDAGSTLTSSETINVGANTLNITGSGFAFNLTGGAVASQLTGSFKAALLDVSSSSTNTVDRSTQFRAYTSGTAAAGYGSGIQFDAERASGGLQAAGYLDYVWTDVSGTYTNNIDFTGADAGALELFMNIQPSGVVRVNNLADTLATKAYARSVGGSGTPVSFGTDNQIPFMNATNDDFEYNAALTWNGTTFAADGGATFNESGANVDFRVEGDADANAFFVDASADAVGVGTNAPAAKLQVMATSGSLLFDVRPSGASHTRFSVNYSTVSGTATLSSSNGDNEANIVFSSGSDLSNTRPDWTVGKVGGNPNVFKIRARYPTGSFYEEYINITAQGETVFNEGGLDRDIRFETDNDANGLFINAGTDRIGIGTASPNAWLGIKAGTTASGQINFAPGVAPSSPNDGDMWYENTNDRLMFRQNATSIEFIGVSAVNSVTPTAQNRTLTVLINGVTYYITAKTTND